MYLNPQIHCILTQAGAPAHRGTRLSAAPHTITMSLPQSVFPTAHSESSAQQSQYHTSSIKIFCANPTLQLTWLLGLGRTHPCTRNHATMYKFRSWDLESVDDGGAPPSACRRKPCRFSIYRAVVHVCSVTLIQFSDCFLHNHIPC